ncbi:hypothetical protein [Bacteroides acidifaciens]|uniref:hypothetical protein n=1 Tax=Bacteroides acidifaciens TaxID=85831 RepID=UPI002432FEFF|nr:hypothetical protein [Bacteroides acidifaciens]
MGDFNSVYPLLGIVILIVLLCRFDGRFTKIEKELDVIKKQMDALLKGQAKMAADTCLHYSPDCIYPEYMV